MNIKTSFVETLYPLVSEHLTANEIERLIEFPNNPDHGDLAFPVFTLAKAFRKAPAQIAQELIGAMGEHPFVEVKAVGPYINVKLQRSQFGQAVVSEILAAEDQYGSSDLGQNQVITIDFSSPNIAKPMSMGHLRSTVIGNAIANIAVKTNYQTVRINHLGDWGTQFGKLIVAYQEWGNEAEVEAQPIQELVKLYVEFHEKAETDPSLEDKGRAAFKALEEGDPEMLRLWKWFKEESLKEFQTVYDKLNIQFDSYNGEAFYNDKMDGVVAELEAKQLLKLDQGAMIVDLEDFDLPPALIKKSDGASLYVTRDLAAAFYRRQSYQFVKAVYVVGNEQKVHFKQLRAVLSKMGYDWSEDMVHVAFGLITLDGKKLSTRKGKIVLLDEVLDEAVAIALDQIENKNPDLANKEEVAQAVGIGAVIFHDLKTDRMNNFDFKLEEIVQFEGETGPYVQYTYARSMSILRKAALSLADSLDNFTLQDDQSWEIIKKLNDYPNVIQQAMERFEPSLVAKYAIQLAQLFNKYYAHVRILEENDELEMRLAIIQALTIVLKDALKLLGLEAPAEM